MRTAPSAAVAAGVWSRTSSGGGYNRSSPLEFCPRSVRLPRSLHDCPDATEASCDTITTGGLTLVGGGGGVCHYAAEGPAVWSCVESVLIFNRYSCREFGLAQAHLRVGHSCGVDHRPRATRRGLQAVGVGRQGPAGTEGRTRPRGAGSAVPRRNSCNPTVHCVAAGSVSQASERPQSAASLMYMLAARSGTKWDTSSLRYPLVLNPERHGPWVGHGSHQRRVRRPRDVRVERGEAVEHGGCFTSVLDRHPRLKGRGEGVRRGVNKKCQLLS